MKLLRNLETISRVCGCTNGAADNCVTDLTTGLFVCMCVCVWFCLKKQQQHILRGLRTISHISSCTKCCYLTLFEVSNSESVASPSPGDIGAKRSRVGVGQEKHGKNAHISTVNLTLQCCQHSLPQISLSSSPVYSESSSHPLTESSTLSVYVLYYNP